MSNHLYPSTSHCEGQWASRWDAATIENRREQSREIMHLVASARLSSEEQENEHSSVKKGSPLEKPSRLT